MQRAGAALPVWPAHQLQRFLVAASIRRPTVAWKNRRKEKTISVRSAKEFEAKGKTEERTEREKRRKMTALLVLPRPAESLENGARFSEKTSTY